ncbi:membrane-spanning 4-domains subfamily A member 18-like [Ptychodera flava]|uniref:membrane-spanning 4-domains subfamily A member 18-like n=1 Tax=Ptychodera flava TaxID=63121 RepID=UPI00396A4202
MNSQEPGRLPVPQIVDAPQQQQTVYMQVPVPAGSLVPNFAHKSSFGFGICQMVLGIILVLLGIVNIFTGGYLSVVGSPIWCGIFIVVTGSLGILTSRRKTKGMIIATLTCSIIAASLSGGLVLPMSLSMALVEGQYAVAACVVDAITTLAALVECVIAIIHSVVCCRAVCCGQQQMIPMYCRVQGQPDAPMQPMTSPVGAQRTMFMMPLGSPFTGQNAGYQGPPPEQFQSYNPQGQHPQGKLNISPEQIIYTEQRPSLD